MRYQGVLLLICCVYNVVGGFYDENGERVGSPDDLADLWRPCPTFDTNCIRKFFSTHAHCRKVFGPAPEPLTRPQTNIYLPRINISFANLNEEIRGINGRIEEFYLNKHTDRLVIAVEFQNLSIANNHTYFIFHRPAREAVVTVAPTSVRFDSVVITAVIPKIDDLQLKRAECVAFSNDANPIVTIGASAAESEDPQVQRTITEFYADMAINVQEYFLTEAYYYLVAYIQYNICDFGLLIGI